MSLFVDTHLRDAWESFHVHSVFSVSSGVIKNTISFTFDAISQHFRSHYEFAVTFTFRTTVASFACRQFSERYLFCLTQYLRSRSHSPAQPVALAPYC